MIELINNFFTEFVSKYLFCGSIFYIIYTIYIFLKCVRKQEKLSESLTQMEKQYFFLAITYLFTYLL
jgi:hypothetical protein